MLKFTGDYHTHTGYSDGEGTVRENVNAALLRGLKELAISDHGFANPFLTLRHKDVPKLKADIDKARAEHPEINIILGIEANIVSLEGDIDMTDKDIDEFELIIMGFHRFAKQKSFRDWRLLTYRAFRSDASRDVIARNTKAIIASIKKYPIDILAHVNDHMIADAKQVAEAASDYGTLVELNSKHIDLIEQTLDAFLSTKVKLIANTDSHKPEEVGDMSLIEKVIRPYGLTRERLVNLDGSYPMFRRYKRTR